MPNSISKSIEKFIFSFNFQVSLMFDSRENPEKYFYTICVKEVNTRLNIPIALRTNRKVFWLNILQNN